MAIKLKMAEKSLFAILLRSPWWISLLVVALFVLASNALLPAGYVVYGVIGGFPFLVIAIVAAWRQSRAPNPTLLKVALERAGAMSWREFSAAIQQAMTRQGYSVNRLEGQAADLRLELQGQVSLVSCRRWKATSQGVEPLRELAAARQALGAQHAIYISLGPPTDQACRYAQDADIGLIHGNDLAVLILSLR
jgi:restriction system protein